MATKKMASIRPGEKQPIECEKCNSAEGYQYSDLVRINYSTIHNADGSQLLATYSDSETMLNEGVSAYCANCHSKLRFKINRK